MPDNRFSQPFLNRLNPPPPDSWWGNGGAMAAGTGRVAGEGGRGGWRAWLGGTNLLVHCVAEQLNAPNLDNSSVST